MVEIEYEIIDELYFVKSFQDIRNSLHISEELLCKSLKHLVELGYVKILYPDPETDQEFEVTDFMEKYQQFYYLATKAGLIHHNSR